MKKKALFVGLLALATSVFSANPGTVSQEQFVALASRVEQLASQSFLLFNTNYAATSTCSNTSHASCLLFITSATVKGNMSIVSGNQYNVTPNPTTGIAAANSICQQEGDRRWGTGRTWAAWISDSTQNAGDAVYQSNKAYVNVMGLVVSEPGKILLPVSDTGDPVLVDPTGTTNSAYWTGTDVNGVASSFTCNDWSTASSSEEGLNGLGQTLLRAWSQNFSTTACNRTFNHLLCFERG